MSATGLLRWLTFLALLFAPLAMIGGPPASAHAQPVAAGHCAEPEAPAEAPPSAPVDGMTACAGCLPAPTGSLASLPHLHAPVRPTALASCLHGFDPGSGNSSASVLLTLRTDRTQSGDRS